jgi:hypothetical protein
MARPPTLSEITPAKTPPIQEPFEIKKNPKKKKIF